MNNMIPDFRLSTLFLFEFAYREKQLDKRQLYVFFAELLAFHFEIPLFAKIIHYKWQKIY